MSYYDFLSECGLNKIAFQFIERIARVNNHLMVQKKTLIYCLLIFPMGLIYAQKKTPRSDSSLVLERALIIGGNPISEKFAVTKKTQLDIYFNANAQADVLKDINMEAGSTNTSETANPEFRGGAAGTSQVYINGAFVLNPVRGSQINGVGFFSLFNTALIKQKYSYPGNPPLTYGNNSAGMVDIQTNDELPYQRLSVTLSSVGGGIALHKQVGKKAFMQFYANAQNGKFYIAMNKKGLPFFNSFQSYNGGLNTRIQLSKHLSFNTYNYFINEGINLKAFRFNFGSDVLAGDNRFFSVNTLDYKKGRSHVRLANSVDYIDGHYSFGNMLSHSKTTRLFFALSHKYRILYNLTVQYGVDFFHSQVRYDSRVPVVFFAQQKEAPTFPFIQSLPFRYTEGYMYADYKITAQTGMSVGVRKNFFLDSNIPSFLSYQFSFYVGFLKRHRMIFAVGNYNSYNTQNAFLITPNLLTAKQIELNYIYNSKKLHIVGGLYGKINTEGTRDLNLVQIPYQGNYKQYLAGAELSVTYNITKYLSFLVSANTLFERTIYDDIRYGGGYPYFLKTSLTYTNPSLFTVGLTYQMHPGTYYTNFEKGPFVPQLNEYIPIFTGFNNARLRRYSRFDITINRMFTIKGGNALLLYMTLNNIFNVYNQSYLYYNRDYTEKHFYPLQLRSIFFGVQFDFIRLLYKKQTQKSI